MTCGSERQDFAVMALFDASGDVMPASRSRRLPPRFDQSLLTIPEELTWGQTVDRLGADIKLTIAGAADKLGAAAGAVGTAILGGNPIWGAVGGAAVGGGHVPRSS